MLNKEVVVLLNDQVNKEFFSAYLYLEISNYFNKEGLEGFANWYYIQAQEERDHAMLFVKYLQNNSEAVTLKQIEDPTSKFTDFKTPIEAALKHEQFVTDSINNIYTAAAAVKEYRTMKFLDWFIEEQGEEEMNAENLISKYDLFATDGKGLYQLDADLATRVHTPPSLVI